MSKKHFFFDMDNTVTPSRSEVSREMVLSMLKLIEKGADIVIVSGARYEQMCSQLGRIAEESALLAQNGNHATTSIGALLWRNELNWIQKKELFNLAYRMYGGLEDDADDIFDLVEDRGCQISFSLVGHNAPREKKLNADPTQEQRKALIQSFAKDIQALEKTYDVHCAIGGTTCIDFYLKNKGENVRAFLEHMRWIPEECVYVGDALFEGGNDASVIGVIDTVQVESVEDTEKFINKAVKLMVRGDMGIDEDELEDDDDEDEDDL